MRKVLSNWLRSAALAIALVAMGADVSLAQVTVAVNDISGRPGESAVVAVDLSGVEGGAAIQSYQLTVGNTNGNVALASVNYTGALASAFTNNNNGTFPSTADVTIGGFSTGTDITTSGTLLFLTFNFVAAGSDTITLTGTTFNAGNPAVAAGSDLSAAVVSSNRFLNASNHNVLTTAPDFVIEITAEDAFTAGDNVISFNFDLDYDPAVVTLGAVSAGDLNASGWTFNSSGGGATGSITVGAFNSGGGALNGAGVIARIAATAAAAGTSTLDLNSVVFNAGTPVYADRDGSVTVTFVAANVPPVASDASASTNNFADVDVTLSATDPDSSPAALTYSVTQPANGSVTLAGNVATYTPDFPFTGDDTFTFTANDGEDDSNVATVTVTSTATAEAVLSGVNEVPFVASPGSGVVNVTIANGVATMTGNFAGLAGDFAASHVHNAPVGQNGGVVQDLTAGVSVDAGNRSGTFNTVVDLSTNAALADAIWNSGAYVNVHSAAYGPGELRGQILPAPNSAPNGTAVRAPSDVKIIGNSGDRLYSVSWLPANDPNGDTVNYLYQMSMNASFTDIVSFDDFSDGNGFRVTVGEAAELYDFVTDADPGMVNVGGTVTLYHRVITTDGSRWTAGTSAEITLERGTVTSNEGEADLPTEFALKGNYPNPFNPSTSIQFDLPEAADVTVTITDMLGRQVLNVPTQAMSAGADRAIQVQAGSLASGLYLYRVVARSAQATYAKVGTMTLIK
ncbi:MAG: CHRD domain-containing protein [Rhodothermales bacterium]|nr:CHRD domain-containing protein [Rhodothermales bacterium]MBO6780155.1 CHRD domain-containing protein [Rhodothermales bacterium]